MFQNQGVLVVVAGIKRGVDSATLNEFNTMASSKDTVNLPAPNGKMPEYYYKKGLNDILNDMCPLA